jgi:glucose/mannose transport system substrate-binding protein
MRSDGMVKALQQMRKMTTEYMDPGMVGRDWDTMSALVGNGEAAFHIMGDWTIGLFTAAGFKPGEDYVCAAAPIDWGGPGFILNADSVVFFQQKDPDYQEGQRLLASTILSPEFQTVFNISKGSIPARLDVDLTQGFNACQQQSQAELKGSIEAGTLVRSMAHNMTVLQKYRGAMMDTITEFVNSPEMTAEEAANIMADAVEAQM